MEKAKEFIRNYMESETSEELERDRLSSLKPEINSLLLVNLPEHVTIKQANALSEIIYSMIANPDWYFEQ